LGPITTIMLRLLLRHRLNDGELTEVSDETVQDLAIELRVRHLAPPEHNRHLDLVPRRGTA
jgi:hypothetical protein